MSKSLAWKVRLSAFPLRRDWSQYTICSLFTLGMSARSAVSCEFRSRCSASNSSIRSWVLLLNMPASIAFMMFSEAFMDSDSLSSR